LPPEDFISDSRNSFLNSIDSFEELYKEEETYVELMNKDFNDLKNSGFRRNHIRDIRKINLIENEIELTKVKNNKDLSDYYLILQENLSKHKVNPTHSKEELQWLLKNFENDIWINILKHKGKIVSGIVLFKMNKKVLHCFYGSVDYNFQYPSVMKYLYWKTMSKAQDEGFKILNFGIDSKFDEKENHNLRLFKAGFGGLHTYRKTVKMWF
jgi:lipid II:glycine glycyltransferase (peptidoglycan interpeptide bridge formation enzyme)